MILIRVPFLTLLERKILGYIRNRCCSMLHLSLKSKNSESNQE